MRKLFVIGMALALCACQNTANTSNTTLNACLTQKAYAALNDGSLVTTDITTLAKNISGACLKQLALEKSGLSSEAIDATTQLLTALKNTQSK